MAMHSNYSNLIGICKTKKSSINIIISAIIPRLKDHSVTDNIYLPRHSIHTWGDPCQNL